MNHTRNTAGGSGGSGGGSVSTGTGISFLCIIFVFLIAFTALVLAGISLSNSGESDDVTLVLEDNTTQELLGSGIWTSIEYHKQLHSSQAWKHTPASEENSLIECRREGIYRAYFSIQLSLLNPVTNTTPLECQDSQLGHEIRATIQYDGQGLLHEIRSSHTRGDIAASFMSKEFLFRADEGDLLRFQFYSLCSEAILSSNGESPYATSATLIICRS